MNWHDDASQAWDLLSCDGVQWFAKQPNKVCGGRLRTLDQLIGTIRNAEVLKWDLYLNANPTRPGAGIKARREDVTAWRYLVVDLDPVDGSPAAPPSDYLLCGARIFSGRGYQFWVPVIDGHKFYIDHKLERGMSGYLRTLPAPPGYIVDTSCSDLARVVRCPGSINQRTGARAAVDRLPDSSKLYAETILACGQFVPEPVVVKVNVDLTSLLDVLPHLTIAARRFLLDGSESPGRHTACFAACKSLQEVGVERDTALSWLDTGSGRCRPPLPYADVQRIVRQVYGK